MFQFWICNTLEECSIDSTNQGTSHRPPPKQPVFTRARNASANASRKLCFFWGESLRDSAKWGAWKRRHSWRTKHSSKIGHDHIFTSVGLISTNGLLTSTVCDFNSLKVQIYWHSSWLHMKVFVAKVLGHIQESFTIIFITCAQSFFTNAHTGISSFKFISLKLIPVQLHYYIANHKLPSWLTTRTAKERYLPSFNFNPVLTVLLNGCTVETC